MTSPLSLSLCSTSRPNRANKPRLFSPVRDFLQDFFYMSDVQVRCLGMEWVPEECPRHAGWVAYRAFPSAWSPCTVLVIRQPRRQCSPYRSSPLTSPMRLLHSSLQRGTTFSALSLNNCFVFCKRLGLLVNTVSSFVQYHLDENNCKNIRMAVIQNTNYSLN